MEPRTYEALKAELQEALESTTRNFLRGLPGADRTRLTAATMTVKVWKVSAKANLNGASS